MNTTIINTATRNLEEDHVHILRLIDVMEHITALDNPDTDHLEKIVDIIKKFADGIHHAKEENEFFPMLVKKGFSPANGPIAVMLNDHVAGRNFVKGMSENITLYKSGRKNSLNAIYANMNGYSQLLRSHIAKENNVLFKMAENALSPSDHEELLNRFSETLKNHSGSVKYINFIEDLASFYGI